MMQRDDGRRDKREAGEDGELDSFLLGGLEELRGNPGTKGYLAKMARELGRFLDGNFNSFEVFNKYRGFCQLKFFVERIGQEKAREVRDAYQRTAAGGRQEEDIQIVEQLVVEDFFQDFSTYIAEFTWSCAKSVGAV
ncbi:hypothetical protein CMI37_27020 [Candidatus Pacearchaeota archaeon]|nr:hypothetical protein [Candidatus Pacearchaeota archaeon]